MLVHLLLLALLITARSTPAASPVAPGAISLIALDTDEPEPPAQPPPPRLPSKRVEEVVPPTEPSVAFDPLSQSTTAAAGSACAPLDAIANALLIDPAAMTAVSTAPRETRSISDAIVIWNAGWSPAAARSEDPLGPVRQMVERTLAVLPPECLEPVVTGPRLMPVAVGERTRLLVFGSGEWAWKQLLAGSPLNESPATPAQPDPETAKPWWQF
ncbi:MAG: hypothetical protein M3Q57_05970 [Pseudomonadota bacterium]|nr:hypothetical protein [Pseudomonadota bacterium]